MSQTDQTETNETADKAATAEAPPAAQPVLDEQLTAAKKEATTNHERYLRAVADLENFRKRAVRDKDELRQFAVSGLMEDLIPVLDNLGLGLGAARQQPDGKSLADGVTLVLEQLKSTLTRHGLKEVNPAGQLFDPHQQECIAHQPSSEFASEMVMQVVRLGYTLNGRLLRPASVIVSSGPAATESASTEIKA